MEFRNKELDFKNNKKFVMGILNITPDSFSDGGKYINKNKALDHVGKMIDDGADIIDVGGESTRPFSEPVGLDTELERVIPIIYEINNNFNTIISVDTYKSRVAEEAVKAGAEIINDISGFTFDKRMVKIASKHNVCCVVMHIKGTPKDMQKNPIYENIMKEIYDFFDNQIKYLKKNNINKIIIDVGFGFGKSTDDNYILLKNLNFYKKLKVPILIGLSRKSMIGQIVEELPEKRISGTIALNSIGIINGADIIRVHDVYQNFQAIKVVEKYLNIR